MVVMRGKRHTSVLPCWQHRTRPATAAMPAPFLFSQQRKLQPCLDEMLQLVEFRQHYSWFMAESPEMPPPIRCHQVLGAGAAFIDKFPKRERKQWSCNKNVAHPLQQHTHTSHCFNHHPTLYVVKPPQCWSNQLTATAGLTTI